MSKAHYHHGNLKEALIEAALDIVTVKGIEALTLRAVAKQVGVSSAAIYRHFPNKNQLIGALVVKGLNGLQAATETVLNSDQPPLERFRLMGNAYADFALKNPELYRLMFMPEVHAAGCPNIGAASEASFAVLIQALRDCQEAGVIHKGDLKEQAFSIWAAVHGTVSLCAERPPTVVPEATLEKGLNMVLRTFIQGVANPAASGRN